MTKRFAAIALTAALIVPTAAYTQTVEAQASSTVPVYRLYNAYSGEHIFTADSSEAGELRNKGWKCESVAWYAPGSGSEPVYSLYNPNNDEIVYTASADEKNGLVNAGWVDAGSTWSSDPAETYPVYRVYNPNASANSHFYTMSVKEKDSLVAAGWRDEGVVWYVSSEGSPFSDAAGNPANVRTTAYWPLNNNLSGSITISGRYSANLETGSSGQSIVDKEGTAYIVDSETYDLGKYVNWEISDHNGQGFDCIINVPIGQEAVVTWRGVTKHVHLKSRYLMYNDTSTGYENIYDSNHKDHFDYNEGSIVMVTCDYTRAGYEWVTYWD